MRNYRPGILPALVLFLATAAFPEFAKADPVVPGEEHCVTNVRTDDHLNLRARPSSSALILTRWNYGQCGVIVTGECQGDWCPAEDGHYAGWVHRHYLAMVSPAIYCVTGVAEWDVLNLRAWPSATSRVLTQLNPHQCDIAFLPYAVGSWQKVRASDWEGWVNSRYLSGQ